MIEIQDQGSEPVESTTKTNSIESQRRAHDNHQDVQFVVLVACPYCGSQIEVSSAGLRWCSVCGEAFALNDSGWPSAGRALNEISLAQLICREDDVAVDSRFRQCWSATKDAVLAADFGIDTQVELPAHLCAEIEEDLEHFH